MASYAGCWLMQLALRRHAFCSCCEGRASAYGQRRRLSPLARKTREPGLTGRPGEAQGAAHISDRCTNRKERHGGLAGLLLCTEGPVKANTPGKIGCPSPAIPSSCDTKSLLLLTPSRPVDTAGPFVWRF